MINPRPTSKDPGLVLMPWSRHSKACELRPFSPFWLHFLTKKICWHFWHYRVYARGQILCFITKWQDLQRSAIVDSGDFYHAKLIIYIPGKKFILCYKWKYNNIQKNCISKIPNMVFWCEVSCKKLCLVFLLTLPKQTKPNQN